MQIICGDKFKALANGETIVFIKANRLQSFVHDVLPKLKPNKPIILISHNADTLFDFRFEALCNDKRIVKIFAQNAAYAHPKVQPIPIGIANPRWPHGNEETLLKVRQLNIPKKKSLYVNFNIKTNKGLRIPLKKKLIGRGFSFTEASLPFEDYLKDLASHKFCICPAGNGIDCHRIWECLYLRTVPLIEAHPCMDFFAQHLPIIVLPDLSKVCVESLSYPSVDWDRFELLDFAYWDID